VTDPAARIDPSAELADDVEIGPEVRIGARARLGHGVSIGAESRVGHDALVGDGVAVGRRVTIHDGALVYARVTIEDGVIVGPRAVLTDDRYPRAITSTDDLARAQVEAEATEGSPIVIRVGASIGAGAIVLGGVDLGSFAMVGAGAVVTKSVPGHALVAGNPARRIGWVCSCGMRLVDDAGEAAAAQPPHYSRHPELRCPSCERVYVYVPDPERLEERAPAARPAD
jgi:UDP-2-acetamido-3-amino-2,3-dideoxy-glucuronate N-acetyltransferase